ncbi:uncharacterized protein LOC133897706 [Phragmites australis]|uniref:uncharacterized protein LOC133897706 n=1 Tax=Phragmites australis TaxID=29695 RepID=UPI002D76FB0F|nr:uncharacterized protein LOC133897706 [Phragmites australis]
MGSCVSLSCLPPSAAAPEVGQVAATAKVVDLDGSMAQFAGPAATAREALTGNGRRGEPCFVCSSDELRFDAPARALAAEEALQPGQLYFVLPLSMLRRRLSGKDMATLAVKASTAPAADAGLAVWGGGYGAAGKRRRTARVAPLVDVSNKENQSEGASWNHHAYRAYGAHKTVCVDGDRTVGKTRHGAGRHGSGARARQYRAGVERLSAIAEGSE